MAEPNLNRRSTLYTYTLFGSTPRVHLKWFFQTFSQAFYKFGQMAQDYGNFWRSDTTARDGTPPMMSAARERDYSVTMSSDRKPNIFFVLGAPGSGKGTQCLKMVERYRFSHLSAGELLRTEQNTPGSQFQSLIEGHIKNGTIVPVAVTCSLLDRSLQNSEFDYFLIDGFPRNKDNLEGWQKEMTDKVNLLGVLFFDCNEDVCMKRCLSRGAAGSGRSDDNEESLRKRFVTFRKDTMPIVDYYKLKKLVYVIDANRSPDEVFQNVQETVDNLVPREIKK